MTVGLVSLLQTGKSSLLSHQSGISTASQNLANVNTEGFSKRDALFQADGRYNGLSNVDVRRRRAMFVGVNILAQESRKAGAEAKMTALASLDRVYADGDGSLGDRLDKFFDTIRTLETSPTDGDLRTNMVAQAQALVDKIKATATEIETQRIQSDQTLEDAVARVNAITSNIASLNEQISKIKGAGDNAYEAMDRRDNLVRELSTFIDITTFEGDDAQVTVLFNGAQPLVENHVSAKLEATLDPNYGNLRRVDLVHDSGVRHDITQEMESGTIGGIIELRDETLPTLLEQLDNFAFDLATNFNAAHTTGFGLDGVSGRDFFETPTGVAGAAASLSLIADLDNNTDWIAASTSVVEAIGGNDNLAVLLDLEDQALAGSNTRTFREEIANAMSSVGRLVQANNVVATESASELQQLNAIRDSATGVSIDEEMLDLTRYQRGYQAGAKIIETTEMMYDVILSL